MQPPVVEQAARAGTLAALRHRNFRLYWIGLLASALAFQVITIAEGWLVYELTNSGTYLGFLGLAAAGPTVLLTLAGGVLADKVNQRRLLLWTSSSVCLLLLLLATLTFLGRIQVWQILVIAFLLGSLAAFDMPARQSLFPHLIDRSDIQNAVALTSAVWQGTRVVGPSLGGVLIAWAGTASCFYLGALGFLAMVVTMAVIRPPATPKGAARPFFQDLADALRFLKKRPLFPTLIGMNFLNGIFGMSYLFLLPIFARDILAVGPQGLGFLHAAAGAGALSMTLVTASFRNLRHKSLLLLGGAALFGVFLVLFAYSSSFPLSILILFQAGMCNSLYLVLTMTVLQTLVPDELRGRIMGIHGITFSLAPLGALQGGFISDLVSAPFAVALGGVVVAAFAVGVAATSREVRRLGQEAL